MQKAPLIREPMPAQITQGYPHVTVVRIGPGTYGNAGIPYFNMIP